MDRLGDVGPHQHVGWRHNSAGAERNAPNRTHFLHHIQQDGRPGFLQNTRAVPNKAEKGEIQFQAMLPKQVCMLAAEKVKEKKFRMLLIYACSLLVPRCSMKGQEQVQCKFYNELGRILVRDFIPVPQLDDLPLEPEDSDFPSVSHQDIGKLKCWTSDKQLWCF